MMRTHSEVTQIAHPSGNAPKAGNYTLVVRAETGLSGNKIEVAVNASVVTPMLELAKTGWGTAKDNPPVLLHLNKGFNTLRLMTKTETSGFSLSAITVLQDRLVSK